MSTAALDVDADVQKQQTNKRIQKFNQDLVFVNSLETKYNPFRVQVSNSMIVVASETRVYFYDLNSLVVCKEYSHDFRNFGLNLSQIDSILYCFDYKTNRFFFPMKMEIFW